MCSQGAVAAQVGTSAQASANTIEETLAKQHPPHEPNPPCRQNPQYFICRTDPVFGVTTKDRIPHSVHIEMELLQFGCEPGL
jgi:hypothetical protein